MLTGVWRRSVPVALTPNHRQRWIAREATVAEGQLAQVELGPSRALNYSFMGAIGTETDPRVSRLPGPARIVHHSSMFTSEATTRGVRVRVHSEYSADQ